MRIAFVYAAAVAVALPVAASAANLPSEFTGLWVATEPTNNACRKADLKEEKNNAPVARVMSVEAGSVNFYETRCTLEQVKRLPNANPNE